MKTFLKVTASAFAVFAAVIGAIVLIDRFVNQNRIEGDYLECDGSDDI